MDFELIWTTPIEMVWTYYFLQFKKAKVKKGKASEVRLVDGRFSPDKIGDLHEMNRWSSCKN